MQRRAWLTTVTLIGAVLGSAGCGGQGQGQLPSTLHLVAVPDKIAFDQSTLAAKSGRVTITMANDSGLPHNVAIEDGGTEANGNVVGKGQTSTVSAALKPGTYTFYCAVPGHRQAGMKGKLTVK